MNSLSSLQDSCFFFTDYSAGGRGLAENSCWPTHWSIWLPSSDPRQVPKTWKEEGRGGKCKPGVHVRPGVQQRDYTELNGLFTLCGCKWGLTQQSPTETPAMELWEMSIWMVTLWGPSSTTWMLLASPALLLSPMGQFSPEQVKRTQLMSTGWCLRTTRGSACLSLLSYFSQPLMNQRKVNIPFSPIMKLYISGKGNSLLSCSGDWNIPSRTGLTQ